MGKYYYFDLIFIIIVINIITHGPVAQLGERLVRNEEVASSILVRSTRIVSNCRSPKSLIRSWTKRRIHRRPSERAVFMSLELLMKGFEARKLPKEIERFLESVFWKHFQSYMSFAEDYHIVVPIGGTRK